MHPLEYLAGRDKIGAAEHAKFTEMLFTFLREEREASERREREAWKRAQVELVALRRREEVLLDALRKSKIPVVQAPVPTPPPSVTTAPATPANGFQSMRRTPRKPLDSAT